MRSEIVFGIIILLSVLLFMGGVGAIDSGPIFPGIVFVILGFSGIISVLMYARANDEDFR